MVRVFLFFVGILWGIVGALCIIEIIDYFKPKIQERFAKRKAWKETKEFIKKL